MRTLGLKINERASVLKHIELGKMEPNNLLANKLERTLKIKLLVPIEVEEKSGDSPKAVAKDQEMTLGDLIELQRLGGAQRTKAIIAQRRQNREPSSLEELKRFS